ncbi:MAG: hypothetical protein H6853_00805 [Rhodospirillales bacterium]|nr:hypothetical protein [Alphaproteobacteria bacterium]USO03855.1 MAG: hypothetical protein H6853_00805 [Rhodospirillales bacterium]
MPDFVPPYALHLQAYQALLETCYADTSSTLFPDGENVSPYKNNGDLDAQAMVCERAGFLLIIGETMTGFERFLACTQDDQTLLSMDAKNFIRDTVEGIENLSNDPEYIASSLAQTREFFGFINETAFLSGKALAVEWMKERIGDFLEIVPVDEPEVRVSTSLKKDAPHNRLH